MLVSRKADDCVSRSSALLETLQPRDSAGWWRSFPDLRVERVSGFVYLGFFRTFGRGVRPLDPTQSFFFTQHRFH